MQPKLSEQYGTLPTTSQVINLESATVPMTITLKYASYSTQKIELSTDAAGAEYFEPTYAVSTATMKVVTVGAPVSRVKFTGVAGNTWSIR